MPELPWRKFMPQDWLSDTKLTVCSCATRGIWIDAISRMMQDCTDRISYPDDQMARMLRCSTHELDAAHTELKSSGAAEVGMQNGCKIWICRRLRRELEIKKIRSTSASSRWCKRDAKPMQSDNAKPHANTHASSASASASVQEGGMGEGSSNTQEQRVQFNEVEVPSWDEFWTYCQNQGLVAEFYARDKFLAAEQENWKRQANWRAYVIRCRVWWEGDGRPLTAKNRVNNFASPAVRLKQLEELIARHPCNKNSLVSGMMKMTTELKAEFADLIERRRLTKLEIVKGANA